MQFCVSTFPQCRQRGDSTPVRCLLGKDSGRGKGKDIRSVCKGVKIRGKEEGPCGRRKGG